MLDLCLAAVDDKAHAWHCDGSFCNVGGKDNFAGVGRGWGEDELLLGLRKGGEERKDLELWLGKSQIRKQ